MIKIAALNKELEEESRSEEEVTREALEQIALQQYAKALELQRKGNVKDATQLLTDLLDTELLDSVKKPPPGEKAVGPLFSLKYLCYKNLASILALAGNVDGAIQAYESASELDDTDITLWHRLGTLCMRASRYEEALHAFHRGLECSPNHWPSIDKVITLLFGLDHLKECIASIYDAFTLDPGYLRGLVYRRHIFRYYPHIKDFMLMLYPHYTWDEDEDKKVYKTFPNSKIESVLKEAEHIQATFLEQQKALQFQTKVPVLRLRKPITRYTWKSVGKSLVDMHQYMTDNYFSHACPLDIVIALKENSAEVAEEDQEPELAEEPPDAENVDDKEKETMDVDRQVEDVEMVVAEAAAETSNSKKKTPVRRRGSALSFLQQWEWCNKRRSGRKKTDSKQDNGDENIYDLLRKMIPQWLNPEIIRSEEARRQEEENSKKAEQAQAAENQNEQDNQDTEEDNSQNAEQPGTSGMSLETMPKHRRPEDTAFQRYQARKSHKEKKTLKYYTKTFKCRKHRKFRYKPRSEDLSIIPEENEHSFAEDDQDYFGSEAELSDVEQFLKDYQEKDIIDIFRAYLYHLAKKWNVKWPKRLPEIYVDVNNRYNLHKDPPACNSDYVDDLVHYTAVNLLAEELSVNEKLHYAYEMSVLRSHEVSVMEHIKTILNLRPEIFVSPDILEFLLRVLWVKLHIFILNKRDEFALDCLYQLSHEVESMGEDRENYYLEIVNFTVKPCVSQAEIGKYIKFLERNKRLATIMDLHRRGHHDEVYTILMDSFDHYKETSKKQQEEMSLDFASQLMLILDTLWALGRILDCFKWSFTCLHEALTHYFRYTSGSQDYERWTNTVVKIVTCMEHILICEGLEILECISRKDLSVGLEDLIRVIGHQVETNAAEMPFKTVTAWIVLHYILQREEDQGRGGPCKIEDVPNALMVLFIGHEHLGYRGWCCQNDGKLLYFILDNVVPRLRSPSLSKALEPICQYMEQCVYCLFGHPTKKNKVKYLTDHNVSPHPLDWNRAQQLYEIFRPPTLPALEGKLSGISADTEQLFHRILALLPKHYEPQKYVPDVERYIKGVENRLPTVPQLLPFKMRDIYFLLGDYYFKKEEGKMAIKFNMLDVVVNRNRLESWAEISLAKAVNLERLLNSCKNINNEKEFLNPAKAIIRCFKRSLELDPSHCNMWIEYGMFVYTVHSFCSRLLKQASESLSMESFEALEKQKEDMLDTTHNCFMTVLNDAEKLSKRDPFGDDDNEDAWLPYYMLGKVAEKRNRPPSEYLKYYMQGIKSLQETDATYPLKINYNSPTHLCIEVLELHYRIHASILKYIEQHENKPIPASVGKVFTDCIEEWKNGPFTKKAKKEGVVDKDQKTTTTKPNDGIVHPANIFKRSSSDVGEINPATKKQKLASAAAKVKRSASCTDRTVLSSKKRDSHPEKHGHSSDTTKLDKDSSCQSAEVSSTTNIPGPSNEGAYEREKDGKCKERTKSSSSSSSSSSGSSSSESSSSSDSSRDSEPAERPLSDEEIMSIVHACLDGLEDCASRFPPHYKAIYRLAHYHFYYKKGKNIERCRDLMLSNFISRAGPKLAGLFSERKHSNFFNNIWKIPLSEVDRAGGFAFHMSRSVLLTMEILKEIDDHKTLLDLSLHLQRIPEPDKKYLRDSDREELAQQAFSLCVQSLKGQLLKFSQQEDLKSNDVERQALKSLMLDIYRAYQRVQKQPNSKQFTNLLVDAYKLVAVVPITENMNLVDLSMKFCQSRIQTLKQQATQASLDKSTAQKKYSAKLLTVDTAKANAPIVAPTVSAPTAGTSQSQPKPEATKPTPLLIPQSPASPVMTAQDIAASLHNFLPVLKDPMFSSQTAAAINYLNNISALAGYPPLQSPLQNTLQNSFQAEFYRQFVTQSLASYNLSPPKPKQKRGPKPGSSRGSHANRSQPRLSRPNPPAPKPSSSVTGIQIQRPSHSSNLPNYTKSTGPSKPSNVSGLPKTSSASLAPSMGTVLSSLPPSMSMNLSSFGGSSLPVSMPSQAHTSSTMTAPTYSKPPPPNTTARPGKTLQEKLAERQKLQPPIGRALSKLPSSVTVTKTTVYKSLPPRVSPTFGEGLHHGDTHDPHRHGESSHRHKDGSHRPKDGSHKHSHRHGDGSHKHSHGSHKHGESSHKHKDGSHRHSDGSHRQKESSRPKQLTEEIIVLDDD